MKYTKNDFISVLCDCRGWSESEALESFNEYDGDLEACLNGYGAGLDSFDIEEMRNFLNK